MSNKRKPTFKQQLAAAKLAQDVVPICLRPDLVAEIKRLDAELDQAESPRKVDNRPRPQRLATPAPEPDSPEPDKVKAAERIEQLREQMRDSTADVTVQALERPVWNQRVREYPPRPGDAADQAQNVNRDAFWPVVIRESIVDPEMDDDDWAKFERIVAGGEWDKLVDAVFSLNRERVDVPFSRRASQILQTASAASEPPAPSGSAPSV